jgi:hypothetical protein
LVVDSAEFKELTVEMVALVEEAVVASADSQQEDLLLQRVREILVEMVDLETLKGLEEAVVEQDLRGLLPLGLLDLVGTDSLIALLVRQLPVVAAEVVEHIYMLQAQEALAVVEQEGQIVLWTDFLEQQTQAAAVEQQVGLDLHQDLAAQGDLE